VEDIWLSIIKTCEVNRFIPWNYLRDLFQKYTADTIMLEHWLPSVLKKRQKTSSINKS
jgi:hypothetical protein